MSHDLEIAEKLAEATNILKEEIGKVIIGQSSVIEELLIGLFANSHCFMVGVPGLAKTLMVSTLSKVLSLQFKRIQFTPDLMPSDITGTDIIQEDPQSGHRQFEFIQGPIFANMILADEINRTPPKTQAALLEAMQERQVTVANKTFTLKPPFFVLATQNPIEQEGTYPLPEAQLDRFMLCILLTYPKPEDELKIYQQTTVPNDVELKPVLTGDDILELQNLVKKVPVGDHVFEYALEIIRKTRPEDDLAPAYIRNWLDVGAGPRAGQNLIQGAKVRALLHGRTYATCDDVKALALPVLRHRLITNFNAETEGVKQDQIINRILQETPFKTDDA
jgi:MoxR-like ATPase